MALYTKPQDSVVPVRQGKLPRRRVLKEEMESVRSKSFFQLCVELKEHEQILAAHWIDT